MRFGGQIRVPDVDHPGVPATFLVDEDHAEMILEGETLGRWSLFDVQVDRLVSKAFQVDLAGEEITFLADEPVEFAYNGVEHMAEVWAKYKTMTLARRLVAVRRSRKGTTPSRLAELHEAMVENLAEEQSSYGRSLAGETVAANSATPSPQVVAEPEPVVSPFTDSPIEDRPEHIPTIPSVGETTGDRADQVEVARAAAELEAERLKATQSLEAERQSLEAERTQVEEQRKRLEEALAEAEHLEGERLKAARLDMERLEAERRSLEQRHETERLETERLEAERKELKTLDAERVKRERAENERFEAQRKELERLEEARIEREQIESKRLEKEREELERADAARAEAARLEMERMEAERKELERLEVERLEAEKQELERFEAEKAELQAALALEAAAVEAKAVEAEAVEAAAIEAAALEAAEAEAEKARIAEEDEKTADPVKEVIATSSGGEGPETAKELVVDVGEMEPRQPDTPRPDPKPSREPAMATVAAKSGIMGAVRSAFSRNGGKNHVHDFTEAPGGIGMVRYICRDCGFVSISSTD